MPNHDDAADYDGLQEFVRRGQAAQEAVNAEIAKLAPACRYYGMSSVHLEFRGLLVSCDGPLPGQESNSCALMFGRHAPCEMEMVRTKPDEALCPHANRAAQLRREAMSVIPVDKERILREAQEELARRKN